MREGSTARIAPWKRAAGLATFAVTGAVAAVASIVPATDAELLIAKAAVLEPVAIRVEEALLPPVSSFVREDRLQRGDTLAALLARLAVGASDTRTLLRLAAMRQIRPGSAVSAEVRADGSH